MKGKKLLAGVSALVLCASIATPTLASNSPNGNRTNPNQVYSVKLFYGLYSNGGMTPTAD